jgi:hypothetical protein
MDTTTNIRRLAPFAGAAAVIALCSAMALPHGTPPPPAPSFHNARVGEYLLGLPHGTPPTPAPPVHNARVAEYMLGQPHATAFHAGPSNATIADRLGG